MQRKNLPIGIQTFSEIRQENHYYVDKTPLALRLIAEGKHYFLSRPRRFGKSLLLDTLKCLFEGRRELFAGLYAEEHWDWSKAYPVLLLTFGGGVLKTHEDLNSELHEQIDTFERAHGLPPTVPDLRGRLKRLIRGLHEKTGERVVVLVDEYDKPILDNLMDVKIARTMRDALRDLYSVLKGADEHLRFVFITGVSKFSKVSLFSGLNNLEDITLVPDYSSLCGYTDHDVDTVFAPELPGLDREEIKRWYNGYNWTGEAVYNPFDLLLLFKYRILKSYWFETGTPTFLVELLAQRQFFTPNLLRLVASEELLGAFDVDRIESAALLWQAGYLTIHAVREVVPGQRFYTLGFPNHEVEVALNISLLGAYGVPGEVSSEARSRFPSYLLEGNTEGLREVLHALYAGIPHDWYRNNPLADYEGHYASIFYSYLSALGMDIRVEDATNKGRIDLALRAGSTVYLFEFKVVGQGPEGKAPLPAIPGLRGISPRSRPSLASAGSALPGASPSSGKALEQLQAKGYAEKYREPGVRVTLVGIEFGREARNLVGFEVAEG